jgi:hypothetical protein
MTQRMMQAWNRLGKDDEASEIAEAALVLPLLFTFLLAIITFGRAFNVYSTLTYAAHEGARAANTSTCATCGNASLPADVSNAITQALQGSKVDPAPLQTYAGTATPVDCGGGAASCSDINGGNIHVCTNIQINATTRRRRFGPPPPPRVTGPVACGSSVSFQYPYRLSLPFTGLNADVMTLKVESQLVSEN